MKSRGMLAGAALAIGVIAASAGGARANLVLNGSFGTGDFTDWIVTGDGIAIDSAFANAPTDIYDASFSAAAGDPTAGTLAQPVTTAPGQGYDLAFSLLDESGFPGNTLDTFNVSFGSFAATLYGEDAAPYANGVDLYTAISFTVPGSDITGISTTLSFEGQNALGAAWNLDDVSVDPVPTVVPEPSGLALLLAALAIGLPALRRRRIRR